MKFQHLLLVLSGMFVLAMVFLWLVGDRSYTFTPIFDEALMQSTLTEVDIASIDEALTFTRYQTSAGAMAVLLVQAYANDRLIGVNLNEALDTDETDIPTLFSIYGYEQLASFPAEFATVEIAASDVALPLDTGNQHIAMGANYPEHGDEVELETPFVFPKVVQPTAWRDELSLQETKLLDYEVELALVMLDDIERGASLPAYVGLILTNDFTDREQMILNMDFFDIESGHGFTDGKSRGGFLPIGNLLVIPKDFQAFYPQIQLALYVNQLLRQRTMAEDMTWHSETILEQIWLGMDRTFINRGQNIRLTSAPDRIEQGTLILTGTPADVVFAPPSFRQVAAGIPGYIFSFNWGNRTPLDAYLAGMHESGHYLQVDDQVVTVATHLGVLHHRIVR